MILLGLQYVCTHIDVQANFLLALGSLQVTRILEKNLLETLLQGSMNVTRSVNRSDIDSKILSSVHETCRTFLSPPVLMHGGLLCVTFRLSICPSVCLSVCPSVTRKLDQKSPISLRQACQFRFKTLYTEQGSTKSALKVLYFRKRVL